ncbi:MAG: riboflavin biosynthesis protein RibF [Lactobacillus sp.]|nr:riboflavin biosynthesis protein RibF [Lactobacillus sp.]
MNEGKIVKIIHLDYPFDASHLPANVVLALGFFDGFHQGHRQIVKMAAEIANDHNLPLMVMTFNRHPKEVYAADQHFPYIDELSEKAAKMAAFGVDYLAVVNFTKAFSQLSAQAFVDGVICQLHASTVVAGFDYTYGAEKTADMAHLASYARGRFDIICVRKQTLNGKKISSTAIRQAIQAGEMAQAAERLGSHYELSGQVVHGKRNGHKLGFPTANLDWSAKKVLPKVGVYATKVLVAGQWYDAMTSVGYNVTIGANTKILIESNLFDFHQDIYGQTITIKWYQYLRPELKFAGLPELKIQLAADERMVRAYFRELAVKVPKA